ncbi:putative inactive tRNA-specific adenosine deaminase-like protein 3-like [Heracleum sosnowskyi]|uniref:Inactive tRNA-specific adenosine deaminase-like protein 3-like n=1 Tax=Heracleum sosnowskyi TaxID=360622 RepID=A0AAD8NC36_9APIA|nr:putative inactive tRNA-specific adenosine deaminase-like protein 3-like [Heracleum sosnowskyi]
MLRKTPEHRLAVAVRGSVSSLWLLLAKHASRTSRKLISTIKNKAIKLRRKKRGAGEDFDGGVWQRTILMGDKCEPLDFSGVIYYDHDGNRVNELPRASPMPSYAYDSEYVK